MKKKGRPELPLNKKRVAIKGTFTILSPVLDVVGIDKIRRDIRELIKQIETSCGIQDL